MSEPPRVTEQIANLIEVIKNNNNELNNKIANLQNSIQKTKENKYKYQSLIDYLKLQGKENELISTSKNECLEPEEALNYLQKLINEQKKQKCLTKEDLYEFFKRSNTSINLEPPFRG